MGKIIYEAKGKASEYAKYAFSAYVGCSNKCSYCYLRKGRFAKILGGDKPTLKKCFKDEDHALEVFEKELKANLSELQKHGLFFSFSTDPMLPETLNLTTNAAGLATDNNIPVKILTKCTEFADWWVEFAQKDMLTHKELWAFGFTLTGHDELEPGASTNAERIEAMKKLHEAGFKTFASIEPVIDISRSLSMVIFTTGICDLLKIGLESGKKYDKNGLIEFIGIVNFTTRRTRKVYWKDSLLKAAGLERSQLPANCVTRDYNIFTDV